MLIDEEATRTMLRISCSILENTFFYDKASIRRFLDIFGDVMATEIIDFQEWANDDFLTHLKTNLQAKMFFTCYFVSVNLHHIFVKHLFFNDKELEIFDSYVSKYSGVKRPNELQPRNQGTHH